MNYVVSVVETLRVPNVKEVEKLHTQMRDDNKFELKKFEYQHKEVKQKGEVIDEYELVKATLVFNNEKEPENHVSINIDTSLFPVSKTSEAEDDNDEDCDNAKEDALPWN
jgi:hypothetical protein